MRVTTRFALPLATLILGLLFVPRAALAQTSANCPIEPATNVPIALGQVFAGTNCNLYTAGDIDSFVFTGKSGYTYELAAALNGASQDICLTLYDPSFNPVPNGQGCTWIWNGQYSVVTYPKLAANGTYTLVLTGVFFRQAKLPCVAATVLPVSPIRDASAQVERPSPR